MSNKLGSGPARFLISHAIAGDSANGFGDSFGRQLR
jgi:hypothetical protein